MPLSLCIPIPTSYSSGERDEDIDAVVPGTYAVMDGACISMDDAVDVMHERDNARD
jgi:hypothetical protein